MTGDRVRGLVDTNIVILRRSIPAASLPLEIAISAITLAELSAGVHLARGDDGVARSERAARVALLQQVESEFSPIQFDARAARMFGRMCAAVASIGRTPRRRATDLMIAATAAVEGLPLFTANPTDFAGLEDLVEVVPVPRP